MLGRTTFDQVVGWGWPYGDKPAGLLDELELGVVPGPSGRAGRALPGGGAILRYRVRCPGRP